MARTFCLFSVRMHMMKARSGKDICLFLKITMVCCRRMRYVAEITKETVQRIAKLATIELKNDEIDTYANQLESIIGYIHKLNELDTKGVPQTTHAMPIQNVWREDKAIPSLEREDVLRNAPDPEEGAFRVPRIIE